MNRRSTIADVNKCSDTPTTFRHCKLHTWRCLLLKSHQRGTAVGAVINLPSCGSNWSCPSFQNFAAICRLSRHRARVRRGATVSCAVSRRTARRHSGASRRLCSPVADRVSLNEEPVNPRQNAREAIVCQLLAEKQYVKAGLELQQLLDDSIESSTPVCSWAIQGLCSASLFDLAWGCYQRVQRAGVKLRYKAFHCLIGAAVRCGRLSEALSAFEALKRQGLQPNSVTYNLLISGLLRSRVRTRGHCSRAYQLWRERLRLLEPLSLAAFTTGVNACVSVGRVDEALELLQRLRRIGLAPNVVVYNILLKAHAQRGDAAAARRLFKGMREMGMKPDAYTFNCLMHCFVVRKELLRVRAVLDKAVREGVAPDVASYTIYMQGLCGAGLVDEAVNLLNEMRQKGLQPNAFTYSTLMTGLVRARRVAEAESLLSSSLSSGLAPNLVLYNTLIKGYCMMDNKTGWARATQLLHEMAERGLSPGMDTFNILLATLIRVPDHVGALALVRQVVDMGLVPDSAVYTTLIKMFRQTGQVDAALKVFGELLRCKGAEVDEAAWGALVSVLAFKGRMEEAEEAAFRAVQYCQDRSKPPPFKAFGALISGYRMSNKSEACVAALRTFIRLGGQPDRKMCDAAIDVCLRNGELKAGLQVLRAMELANLDVDKRRYKAWFDAFGMQARQQAAEAAIGRLDANVYLERMKFWLGLPNSYYNNDWP